MHPKTNCKFLKNYTLFSIDKIELQANIFCANLLLTNISDYKEYTYEVISKITHIPVEIVKLKKIDFTQI
jgi:Zn-dependent peptidase ImmA (M78 family)